MIQRPKLKTFVSFSDRNTERAIGALLLDTDHLSIKTYLVENEEDIGGITAGKYYTRDEMEKLEYERTKSPGNVPGAT